MATKRNLKNEAPELTNEDIETLRDGDVIVVDEPNDSDVSSEERAAIDALLEEFGSFADVLAEINSMRNQLRSANPLVSEWQRSVDRLNARILKQQALLRENGIQGG